MVVKCVVEEEEEEEEEATTTTTIATTTTPLTPESRKQLVHQMIGDIIR